MQNFSMTFKAKRNETREQELEKAYWYCWDRYEAMDKEPPYNWYEIEGAANRLIMRYEGDDLKGYSDRLWEEYLETGTVGGVAAEFEEEC